MIFHSYVSLPEGKLTTNTKGPWLSWSLVLLRSWINWVLRNAESHCPASQGMKRPLQADHLICEYGILHDLYHFISWFALCTFFLQPRFWVISCWILPGNHLFHEISQANLQVKRWWWPKNVWPCFGTSKIQTFHIPTDLRIHDWRPSKN